MRRAGEEFGGYLLLRSLGSGGMGTVYEALDADGRHVALKLLHPHIGADPAARDRLRREVATLHRVRHAGVARVLDAEVDSDDAFVVTELVEGRTLEAAVRDDGPFAGPALAALAHGLAGALMAIHAAGVVHRDVKPANVMLTADGPVLIDFGISQILEEAERLTQTGMVTGTPGYLDPQVVAGSGPSAAADWWAWAAVLAFAATGRPPFGRGPLEAVLGRVARGDADLAGLPADLARAIRAALAPVPSARFSPSAVLAVLDGDSSALAALDPPTPDPPTPDPPALPPPAVAPSPPAVAGAAAAPPPPPRPPTTAPRRAAGPIAGPFPPAGPSAGVTYPPAGTSGPRAAAGPPLPDVNRPTPSRPALGDPYAAVRGAAPAVTGPRPGAAPGGVPAGAPAGMPAWPAHEASAPRRSGVLAALWFAATGLAALWPGVVAIAAGVAMVAAGAVGSAVRATRARRARSGIRASDVPLAWASSPWHLLVGALVVAVGLVPGALAGGAVWLVGWLVATGGSGTLAEAGGAAEAAVTSAALGAALGATWLSPSGGLPRRGAREALAALVPGRAGRAVVVVMAIAVAVVAATVVLVGGAAPDFVPFASPSG